MIRQKEARHGLIVLLLMAVATIAPLVAIDVSLHQTAQVKVLVIGLPAPAMM
ncbi:hypothetical protein WSK_3389 [Novosphingobium sp. Rr 2-17]|nr:hypothetical protein WSK_3389 [Novosphingobium sp. Rr 2-17]